jgi:glutamine amidotransferase-like uncharacterized protein
VGAKAVELKVDQEAFKSGILPQSFRSYYNGGGVFVDAAKFADKGVETLATYTDPLDVDGGEGPAAIVYCKVGEGGALLTGTHPEYVQMPLYVVFTHNSPDSLPSILIQNAPFRIIPSLSRHWLMMMSRGRTS